MFGLSALEDDVLGEEVFLDRPSPLKPGKRKEFGHISTKQVRAGIETLVTSKVLLRKTIMEVFVAS